MGNARHVYFVRFEDLPDLLRIGRRTIEGARKRVRKELLRGDYVTDDRTIWIDADLLRRSADQRSYVDVETVTVAIHPEEPACVSCTGHDWHDEIAHSTGGNNVVCPSRCVREGCNLRKIEETRPSRPDNGQPAPTHAIRYERL